MTIHSSPIPRMLLCACRSKRGLCSAVPDAAPGDVGGGGGSRSELVITWEVNHQSYVLILFILE